MLEEFTQAGKRYSGVKRIFLADGDIMILPFEQLKLYLEELNRNFPDLSRVNVYANGSSILAKSPDELKELRKLKLTTLYLGLESGDQEILNLVSKGETVNGMIEAVQLAQDCGMRCSVMILLGLGGKHMSSQHAASTAEALNKMQPRLLSALRFIEVPNTKMFEGYKAVSEYEAVAELREIIAGLDLKRTVFRANHSSNPIPLEGRFPQNKQDLLHYLDALLSSGRLDKHGPGTVPMFL
jgi:radical SAM superfamily enzyme YgiQ (UPF0313 family)